MTTTPINIMATMTRSFRALPLVTFTPERPLTRPLRQPGLLARLLGPRRRPAPREIQQLSEHLLRDLGITDTCTR